MKRLFTLFLALSVCVGVFTLGALGASNERIVAFPFNNGTELNHVNDQAHISAANGFVIFGGTNLVLDCNVQDNALLIRDTTPDAFFDLQLYQAASIPKVRQNATLSLMLKITDTASACGSLVSFRDSSVGSFDPFSFGFSGTDLLLSNASIGKLNVNAFNQIDLQFLYNEVTAKFESIRIFLNGTQVGAYTLSVNVATLDHFRMCRYNRGSYVLDELTYSYGATADSPSQGGSDALDRLIASIPDDQKHTTVVIASFDFDDVTSINTSGDALNQSGGIQAMNGLAATVQNGEAVIQTTSADTFIDFQFYNLSQFPRVDEDFVFSMKIKPLSADFSSAHLMDFRYNNGDWVSKSVSISNCQLKLNGTTVGQLPVGEYSLVEFVFHYSPTGESTFSSYDLLLNGKTVGSYFFTTEAVSINHFRMLRYRAGSFALDDVSLVYGVNSLLYQGEKIHWLDEKKTNVDIIPQMPADLPKNEKPPLITEDTPLDLTQSDASTTDANEKTAARGCKSRISAELSLLLILLGCGLMTFQSSKKTGGKV